MTATRVHFLTLHPGDRFAYDPEGPTYRRAPDTGKRGHERVAVERWETDRWVPSGLQELPGCFVFPIDSDEPTTEGGD